MSPADTPATEILVLCVYQEMGETFLQAVKADPGSHTADLNGAHVHFSILAGDPRVNPGWEESVRKASALMLLVRFMDVISMDKVKAIYRHLPADQSLPMVVVLFREEGESDFKMSCPACGQKLWVRDQDVGKRGRCPNCKRPFRLPAQEEHLKAQLLLPDAMQILVVDRGDLDSCRNSVARLLQQASAGITDKTFDPDVLKQTTMRIQVSGDTAVGENHG